MSLSIDEINEVWDGVFDNLPDPKKTKNPYLENAIKLAIVSKRRVIRKRKGAIRMGKGKGKGKPKPC